MVSADGKLELDEIQCPFNMRIEYEESDMKHPFYVTETRMTAVDIMLPLVVGAVHMCAHEGNEHAHGRLAAMAGVLQQLSIYVKQPMADDGWLENVQVCLTHEEFDAYIYTRQHASPEITKALMAATKRAVAEDKAA